VIALLMERPLPTCASAAPGATPPTWLVATVCTALTLPKLVCAVACAWPLEPLAVDCAVAIPVRPKVQLQHQAAVEVCELLNFRAGKSSRWGTDLKRRGWLR
jgi:hypothetical protein